MINVAFGHPVSPQPLQRGLRATSWAVALAAVLAGCSSVSAPSGGTTPAPTPGATAAAPAPAPAAAPAAASSNTSFTSRVKSFFTGDSGGTLAAAPATPGAAAASSLDCPSVDYRQGAATYTLNEGNAENDALSVRYQASFIQTARECLVRGQELTIKVGVQGRVVVGPAGGPGSVNIPLRYALVREGLQPRTVWTKLYNFAVAIPDGQLNVPFIHVEEEMTVPVPSSADLDAYVIYIGFDPDAVAPVQKPKPAAKPKSGRAKS